jgi:hypothetical protein
MDQSHVQLLLHCFDLNLNQRGTNICPRTVLDWTKFELFTLQPWSFVSFGFVVDTTARRILKAHSHSMSGSSIWASLECHCCFWPYYVITHPLAIATQWKLRLTLKGSSLALSKESSDWTVSELLENRRTNSSLPISWLILSRSIYSQRLYADYVNSIKTHLCKYFVTNAIRSVSWLKNT